MITGGAGFIGSHIVDRLMETGCEVVVFDNLSSGKMGFIEHHLDKTNFSLIKGDLLNTDEIDAACSGVDLVYHAAANPDVRVGAVDTMVHFEQNITATYNLLEAMRKRGVPNIAFTSTSTVYGEAAAIPTPEEYGPLVPISFCTGLLNLHVKRSLHLSPTLSICIHGYSGSRISLVTGVRMVLLWILLKN